MSMQAKYQKPAGCVGCALEQLGTGYVPDSGPSTSRLVFVGEAAGPEEAVTGVPFHGAAGGVLSRVLHRAGVQRDFVRIDNSCRCYPPNMWFDSKAPWYYAALSQCGQYLNETLAQVPKDGVVVTLGATALKTVLHLHGVEGVQVKDFHGTVSRDPFDRFWVVPTFHPSHLQRGAMNLLEVVTCDLQLADRIASTGFVRSPCVLVIDPVVDRFAAWVDRHLLAVSRDPDTTWLAIDTEFAEKSTGGDEGELTDWDPNAGITHFNCANRRDEGVSVPDAPEYRPHIERLLKGVTDADAIVFAWNKYADLDHLRGAGYTVPLGTMDLMWLWHYLQSDLPRGLGFVAAMASDFGPWKHWARKTETFGAYRTADGVQTYRAAEWIVPAAQQCGVFDVFLRDWHERDRYVLRPAHEMGVPVDRAALEAFHQELQGKQAALLEVIKQSAAQGTVKPKLGYAKRPRRTPCDICNGTGIIVLGGMDKPDVRCATCQGSGDVDPVPPASVLGTSKRKKGGEAKAAYVAEEVRLVERDITVVVRVCESCRAVEVGSKHNCLRPRPRKGEGSGNGSHHHPVLLSEMRTVRRWFWQLPFNPDAAQQILKYITRAGHEAPRHKKTKKFTTDAHALKALAAKTKDPLYDRLLDWRSVQKIDSTYVMGTSARLDGNDRVHPEILPIPSTLRDSSRDPNLQNVTQDHAGPASLAAGFRRVIVSRDGLPPGVTDVEVEQWTRTWGTETTV